MSKHSSNSGSHDRHFVKMAEWLGLEFEAEVQRMTERRKLMGTKRAESGGETILNLAIQEHTRGLGGRYLITLARKNREQPMPWHRLSVGSPIVVSSHPDDDGSSLTGVVSARRPDSIQVALDQWPDWQTFRVDLTSDEVTRQRMMTAINNGMNATGRLGKLRKVLMGEREPEFAPPVDIEFQTRLNNSQQEAVAFALSAHDLAIIHGPPGTGKTTTVAELIVQAVQRGDSVLACAPTNTAVDNLLVRLVELKQNIVRIGHPARVNQNLQEYTLDGLVEQSDEMAVIRSMRREADDLFRQAERFTRAKPGRGEKAEIRREARQLISHARLMEKRTMNYFLDRADVICATTTLNESLIGDRRFDLLVIDEACQSVEPGCWIPLQRCDRVVLAGDHCQLPPTILSRQAAKEGFDISLMQREINLWQEAVTRMLDVQYRMHDDIMQFSSQHFYDEQLTGHESVKQHLLAGLPDVKANELTESPALFIDTAGAGWDEEQEAEGLSRFNRNEAELIRTYTDQLIQSGLDASDIAIIAPYAAQARWLRRNNSHENLEIDTVDGFQGREKEAVLITLVRSNSKGEIGFLGESRRMNVALTRARRKLIIIGDSATVGSDPFFNDLIDYMQSIGAYKSVWEVTEVN